MLGIYLERKFRYNNRIVNIRYSRTVYGKDLQLKGQNHDRQAIIYTNCYDSKKFGVRLQQYDYYPGKSVTERWFGGKCVGTKFSYKKARQIAIDFITKNKVYGEQ